MRHSALVRILAPKTPAEATQYPYVKMAQFRPSREVVAVEVDRGVILLAIPGACHDLNIKGNCYRGKNANCKFDCYYLLLNSNFETINDEVKYNCIRAEIC